MKKKLFYLFLFISIFSLFIFLSASTIDDSTKFSSNETTNPSITKTPLSYTTDCTPYLIENKSIEGCSDLPICSNDETCILAGNRFLEGLTKILKNTSKREVPVDTDKEVELATFSVKMDSVTSEKPLSKEDFDTYKMFWDDFSFIIPLKYRYDINEFVVFEGSWMQAYFLMTDLDYGKGWTFAINNVGFASAKLALETYIHEFSHLFSLRQGQINYFDDDATCSSLYIDSLCIMPDSYLYAFYDAFYVKHPVTSKDSDFVSSYAKDSVTEDFSESFTSFVLSKKDESNQTLSNQKINFFYNYPEFVQMRTEILSRSIDWIPKSIFFKS